MTDTTSLSGKRCALVRGGGRGIGFEICRNLAENEIRMILTDRKQKDAIEAVEKLKLSGNLDVVSHQLDVKDSARGGRGIGFEICRKLVENEIRVILTARNEKNGIEAVKKLKLAGFSDVDFHQLDVKDSASIAAVANYVKSNFGKLDILVNNAAAPGLVIVKPQELRSFKDGAGFVIDENVQLLEELFVEDYELAEDCLRTNYYGTKAVTTEMLPLLQLSNSARIVNLSSFYGELNVSG